MKRWLWVLLACMQTAMGAAALAEVPESDTTTPRLGIAVAAPGAQEGTVPMYAIPDPQGEVLMNYFSGAQVEVVGLSKDGMVQVQAGEPGASIMGYMRAEDLRYGAQAMREVPMVTMALDAEWYTMVYSYCDAGAPVAWQWDGASIEHAMGVSPNGFYQLANVYGTGGDWSGFVSANDVEASEPERRDGYAVELLEGEVTREEAYALAIRYLLDNPQISAVQKLPQELRSREGLESMHVQMRLRFLIDRGSPVWWVILEDENHEHSLDVEITPQGEVIGAERGNG